MLLIKYPSQFFLLLTLSILLSACGDSRSDSDNTISENDDPPPEILTGQFVGTPVSGLRYATPSQSGVTGASGSFNYLSGEEVTFYVGDLLLGSATGKTLISLFDLVPNARAFSDRGEIIDALVNDIHFQAVFNIARLLQSLDYDADVSNGITITDSMAAYFEADALNFYTDLIVFEDKFEKIFKQLRSQNLFASIHFMREPQTVMHHLYASLPEVKGPIGRSAYELFSAADNSLLYAYINRFDHLGNTVYVVHDYEGDGVEDYYRSAAYDDRGQQTRFEEDENADGNSERSISTDFDANGNFVQKTEEYDWDSSGQANYIYVERPVDKGFQALANTFDSAGNRIRSDIYNYSDLFNLLDFTAMSVDPNISEVAYAYQYDDQGNNISETRNEDADPEADYSYQATYDDNYNILSASADIDGDAIVDDVEQYVYDDKGRLLQYTINTVIEDVEYDSHGNKTQFTKTNGGMTEPFYEQRCEYNHDGKILSLQINDRENNRSHTETYEYNSDGSLAAIVSDTDSVLFEYNANGQRIKTTVIERGDSGLPASQQVWYFDDQGMDIRFELDEDNDGNLENFTNYRVDHATGTATFEGDSDGDGEVDEVGSLSYEFNADWYEIFESVYSTLRGTDSFYQRGSCHFRRL